MRTRCKQLIKSSLSSYINTVDLGVFNLQSLCKLYAKKSRKRFTCLLVGSISQKKLEYEWVGLVLTLVYSTEKHMSRVNFLCVQLQLLLKRIHLLICLSFNYKKQAREKLLGQNVYLCHFNGRHLDFIVGTPVKISLKFLQTFDSFLGF